MLYTTNLNLKKPESTDTINVEDFNGNADILDAALQGKVDKVAGKGLSQEDYSTAEKTKLAGIAAGANLYVHPNHTGDITSNGDGVTAIAPGVIVNADINVSAAIDATKIAGGTVDNTEFDYLNGVTGPIQSQLDAKSAVGDYIRQPGYAAATGSVNAYAITLSPALAVYDAGVCVAVKINVANTGASTLNVNGLGAKAILDSKGNAMTAGKLKSDSIYTLRYNGTAFILQGDGTDEASDILGKIKTVDGASSGLDADLLDGRQAKQYLNWDWGGPPLNSPLPKAATRLTQYSSSNSHVAPVISGSQHFLLQVSTDEVNENNAFGAQLALNYDVYSPGIAIRTFNPAAYSSWQKIWTENMLRINAGVLEFIDGGVWKPVSAVKGVQRGTAVLGTNSVNMTVTISTVNLSKSFVIHSNESNTAGNNDAASMINKTAIRAQLTDASTITFSRNGVNSYGPINIDWQVIEYY